MLSFGVEGVHLVDHTRLTSVNTLWYRSSVTVDGQLTPSEGYRSWPVSSLFNKWLMKLSSWSGMYRVPALLTVILKRKVQRLVKMYAVRSHYFEIESKKCCQKISPLVVKVYLGTSPLNIFLLDTP